MEQFDVCVFVASGTIFDEFGLIVSSSFRISAMVLSYRSLLTGVRMIVRSKLEQTYITPLVFTRLYELNSDTAMTLLRFQVIRI